MSETSTIMPPLAPEALVPLEEMPENPPAVLETDNGLYLFVPLEADTEAIFQLLQQFNTQWLAAQTPQAFSTFTSEHQVFFFSTSFVSTENEIQQLLHLLSPPTLSPESSPVQTKEAPPHRQDSLSTPLSHNKQQQMHTPPSVTPLSVPTSIAPPKAKKEVTHASLFTLAKSVYQTPKGSQETSKAEQKQQHSSFANIAKPTIEESPYLLFKRQKEEEGKQRQGGGGQQKEQQQREQQHQKKRPAIRVEATRESASTEEPPQPPEKTLSGVENIFIRFMALMARILGQAEAEAHELYGKIKERTDNIDTLTTLIQKINAINGEINWTQNEEMKRLVEKARELGVEIPPGKLKWSTEEKKLLKENIQMRKDSMEKITQLERTDMQRYLQEASQCHQARSNVLKLLKEVVDTIVHNIRP